jgi:succinoglycan biosynthesis protein ExoL
MLHILYLVHDLSDPAVRRRVMMLTAGGARVTLAGFRRTDKVVSEVAGLRPIDLGVTADGRFVQRIAAISAAAARLGSTLRGLAAPDVIIGRNLEMLALANRARSLFGSKCPIVYEALDIHRLLLREDFLGQGLRRAERALSRNAELLLTSSPAFLREYFDARGQFEAPTMLLENKVLELGEAGDDGVAPAVTLQRPTRIGWFGALRCRRSLELLGAFTQRMEGRFEVILRGRPALSEFTDFHADVAAQPHIRFEGAYRNPEDLPAIYGEVHFSWAIDFFEAGQNSDWLLPNRLYEGCRYGVVPIALAGTETARFLEDNALGLILPEASPEALINLLAPVDAGSYAIERARVGAHGRQKWIVDAAGCRDLVARLEGLETGGRSIVPEGVAA